MQIIFVKNYKVYDSLEDVAVTLTSHSEKEPKYEIDIMRNVELSVFPNISTMVHFENTDFIVSLQDIYYPINGEPEYCCIESDFVFNEEGITEICGKIIDLIQTGKWFLCEKTKEGYVSISSKKEIKKFFEKLGKQE